MNTKLKFKIFVLTLLIAVAGKTANADQYFQNTITDSSATCDYLSVKLNQDCNSWYETFSCDGDFRCTFATGNTYWDWNAADGLCEGGTTCGITISNR